MLQGFEEISRTPPVDGGEWLYARIIYYDYKPQEEGIRFFGDKSESLQLACISYPMGYKVPAHIHKEQSRFTPNTQEILQVRNGSIRVRFYTSVGELVAERVLYAGDLVHLIEGGHSVEILTPDTVVLEIKTGPYYGREQDKVLLNIKE